MRGRERSEGGRQGGRKGGREGGRKRWRERGSATGGAGRRGARCGAKRRLFVEEGELVVAADELRAQDVPLVDNLRAGI